MQKLTILILLLVISTVYGIDRTERAMVYFGRQSSARSEAMGRGMVAVADGVFSATQNPALITAIEGVEAVYSHSSTQNPYFEDWKYNNFGVGYNYGNIIFGAVLIRQQSRDMDLFATGENGEELGLITYSEVFRDYNISLAGKYQLFSETELSGGVNFNIVHDEFNKIFKTIKENSISTDLGINLITKTDDLTKFNLSASLTNISASKYGSLEYISDQNELPQIAKFGVSGEFITDQPEFSTANFMFLRTILTCQYQYILNDDVHDGFSFGSEFQFMEILNLRAGYYKERIDESNSSDTKEWLEEFTYGFGLNLPIAKQTNNRIPLNISLDFTRLPQPSFAGDSPKLNDFTSIAVKANYLL